MKAYSTHFSFFSGLIISFLLLAFNPVQATVNAAFTTTAPQWQGISIHFFDQSSSQPGYVTHWVWSFGDGSPNVVVNYPSVPDADHSYSSPGNYTVTLTVTNSLGSTSSVSQQVAVIASNLPIASFWRSNICLGSTTYFTDMSQTPSGSSIVSWNWNFGDPGSGTSNTSSLQNPIHTYTSTGSYPISLTITNSQSLTSSMTKYVTINVPPTANFSYPSQNCQLQEVFFNDLSFTPVGFINVYDWTFGDGSQQRVMYPDFPNVSHTYSQSGTFIVTLHIQALYDQSYYDSCSNFISKSVTISPPPIANFLFSGQTEGQPVDFIDISQSSSGSIVHWDWNFGDPVSGVNNTSNLQNPQHIYSNPGNYTVREIVTNSNSCIDTLYRTMTIYPAQSIDFIFSGQCSNSPTQFTATGNTGSVAMWEYQFGDGMNSNMQNPVHYYSSSGTYLVQLSTTDTLGNSTVVSHEVVIHPLPAAHFTVSAMNCAEMYFFDQSSTANGYITSWLWDFGDGTTMLVNFPSNTDVMHTYANAGSYNVTLTVTTNDSCVDSESQTTTVQSAPLANYSYSLPTCDQSSIQFTDLSQANGSGTIISRLWDFGDPASGTSNNSTLQNPTHTFTSYGNYTVTLTVSSSNGCNSEQSQQVTISSTPNTQFTFTQPILYQEVQFTDQSVSLNSPVVQWTWLFGDGSFSFLQNPVHSYYAPGYYTVALTVTNTAGCTNSTDSVLFVPSIGTGIFLFGSVYAGNEAIDLVDVDLIKVDSTGLPLLTRSSVTTGNNHEFVFTDVEPGNYYLHAIPSNPQYEDSYLPTYYTNSVFWETATLINPDTNQFQYNIYLAPYELLVSGTYTINGQLMYGGKSISVANQEVLLLDNQNTVVQSVFTDNDGNFSFGSLPAGTYAVNPVMTGFTTYPYFVVLDGTSSPAYVRMIISGQIITAVEEPVSGNQVIKVFPNPANKSVNIGAKELIQRISIYDIIGNLVQEERPNERIYRANVSTLPSGVYIIKVSTSKQEFPLKIVVKH